jgi:phage terminase small subunit
MDLITRRTEHPLAHVSHKEAVMASPELPAEVEGVDPYPTLKPGHQRFIDQLLRNGGNQTQAWIASGHTANPDSARVNASRALRDPAVRHAYEMRKAQLAARAAITVEAIAAELANHAWHDPVDLYDPASFTLKPLSEWPAELRRCVQEITYIPPGEKSQGHVKVKWVNRQAALELLGKYKGMFGDAKEQGEQRQLILDLTVETTTALRIEQHQAGPLTLDLSSTESEPPVLDVTPDAHSGRRAASARGGE